MKMERKYVKQKDGNVKITEVGTVTLSKEQLANNYKKMCEALVSWEKNVENEKKLIEDMKKPENWEKQVAQEKKNLEDMNKTVLRIKSDKKEFETNMKRLGLKDIFLSTNPLVS